MSRFDGMIEFIAFIVVQSAGRAREDVAKKKAK
jgi:hypothetical protein